MSALLYAIVGGAVVGAGVRMRWWSLRAGALLFLLPLIITGPALVTRSVFAPADIAYTTEPLAAVAERVGVTHVASPNTTDMYAEFMPWYAAARFALRHRQWPLWEPFELCGTVLLAALQVAPFHPLQLLALVLPLPDALTFLAAMTFFAAAVTMFLFIRSIGLSESAALIAATGWMFSTHLGLFIGTAHGLALSTAPLVLAGAGAVARRPDVRSAALLTVSLVLLILAGHPESVLYVLTIAVPWFFVVLHSEGGDRRRAIVIGFACGAAALLLTAVVLLPFVDALPQTEELRYRTGVLPQSQQFPSPARFVHELTGELMPMIEGVSGFDVRTHSAELVHHSLGSSYAGLLILGLAIAAIVTDRSVEQRFFLACAVFGILAGTGVLSPILSHLPLFNIAVNERMIWITALSATTLAAMACDRFPARRGMTAIVLGVVAIVFIAAAMAMFPTLRIAGLSTTFLRVNMMRAAAPVALAAAAMTLPHRRALIAAVFLLVIAQRVGEAGYLRMGVAREAFYPPFPGLEVMRRGDEPVRFVAQHGILPPITGAHYELEDARGFPAITSARIDALIPFWSVREVVWSNRVDRLDSPLLDLMNVRFAIVHPYAAMPSWWTIRFRSPGYLIAENSRSLPRAFIPRTVHFVSNGADARAAITQARDPGAEAWIESSASGGAVNGTGTLRIARVGTELDLQASIQAPAWIVVSETAWNGWRARERGRDLPVHVADSAFLAFELPAGEHHVRLAYRPGSFVVGGFISAATLLVCVGLLVIAGRRARSPVPADDYVR